MSSARKCDRCGKYYDCPASKSIKSEQVIGIRIQTLNSTYFNDYDLCPKCADKLLKFMGIKEDDKEKVDSGLFPYNEYGGIV